MSSARVEQQPPPPQPTSKYHLVHKSLQDVKDDEFDYAGFLMSRERNCCPDGYVDSRRFTYQYQLHSPDFTLSRLRPEGARQPLGSQAKIVALSVDRDNFERQHARNLKRTEDQIQKSKQNERVAKRQEGDVLKDQREIRIARREFAKENDRQQSDENQRLAKGMEKYTDIQRQETHRKATLVHQRMLEALQQREENLGSGRKSMNKCLGLSRQYRSKLDALQLKRLEVDRVMADYEKRLRLKKQEEEALSRELQELGVQLGMERMKNKELSLQQLQQRQLGERQRVEEDQQHEDSVQQQLRHGSSEQKDSVLRQRRLSAQLSRRHAQLDMKKRQDDRALIDTRATLKEESQRQRSLEQELARWDTEREKAQMEQKVAEVRQRRRSEAQRRQAERRSRCQESEAFYVERAAARAAAAEQGEHDDAVRHLQRVVNRLEEEEKSLYQKVRAAESQRQDEEQQVRRLQSQLRQLRELHDSSAQQQLRSAGRSERKTREQLVQHKSRLGALTAQREEAYLRLQHKQQELSRDRDALQKEQQEQQRLAQVAEK